MQIKQHCASRDLKINPKTWKKIQKSAYLFYTLIYVHILILDIPKARSGNKEYLFNVMAYSVIFIFYAICRIRKYLLIRKKIQNKILLNTISSVIGAVAVCGVAFYIRPISQNTMEIRSEKTAIVSESVTEISSMKETFSVVNTQPSTQPTTASATATEIPTQKTSEKTTVASAQSSTQIPSQVSTQPPTQIIISPTEIITYQINENPVVTETPQENNNLPVQQEIPQNIPVPTTEIIVPTEPEKIYLYNNGTYTATAFGYDGDVTISITVKDDTITDIQGTTTESDDYYFSMEKKMFSDKF